MSIRPTASVLGVLLLWASSGGAALQAQEQETSHHLDIDTPDKGYLHFPPRILDRSTREAVTFDPLAGKPATISYRLTRDGNIRIRVVWRRDPSLVLNTLLDWTHQNFGHQSVTWDGRDASGNLVDNRGCLVTFEGDDRRHQTHDPATDCHDLAVEIVAPNPENGVSDLSQIRARIVRGTAAGRRSGFRLRCYIDYVLVHESHLAAGVDSFALPALSAVGDGEHYVVLNLDDGADHVGVASVRLRFLSREAQHERGQKVFVERGCGSCHALDVADAREDGPGLRFIGSRRPARFLRQVVIDPGSLNRTTRMPAEVLTAAELEALVGYLASMRREPGGRRAGGEIYLEEGCADCHEGADPAKALRGPPLQAVMKLRSAEYLRDVVLTPQKMFPGTAMPPLLIGEAELVVLIEYLHGL